MALGWAIYGTWNRWTWWLHEILVHGDLNTRFFEHEIFWTRIARITRIFLAHGAFLREFFGTRISDFAFGTLITRFFSHEIFLNTNNTNIFKHTDLGFCLRHFEHEIFWTRITRMLFCTRISLISWILSLRLVVNDNSLWLLTRCGYWLVVVIDSLWLLTHCGYWLVVVIGLLCFKWQIKKDVREPCEALADPWDLWDPCA